MPATVRAAPAKITDTVPTGFANAPMKTDAGGAFEYMLYRVRMADRDVGLLGAPSRSAIPFVTRPPDTQASSATPKSEESMPSGAVAASKPSCPRKKVHHAATPVDVSAQGTPPEILPAQSVPQIAAALEPSRAPMPAVVSNPSHSVAAAPIRDHSARPATTTADVCDTDPNPETSRAGDTENGEALGQGASKPRDSTVSLPIPDQAPAVATKPESAESNRKRLMGSAENIAAPPTGSANDQGSADVTAFPILLPFSLAPALISSASPEAATGAAAPAAQLAPALMTLAKTTDGTQQMTLRLLPGDLGMVQVRIERDPSGLTRVDISAANPGTLDALRAGQPQLHRTLDEAGVASAGRSVTFHAIHPADPASGGASQGHAGGSQPMPGRSGSFDTNGSSGGTKGEPPPRGTNIAFGSQRRNSAPPSAGSNPGPITTSYRVSLDITA